MRKKLFFFSLASLLCLSLSCCKDSTGYVEEEISETMKRLRGLIEIEFAARYTLLIHNNATTIPSRVVERIELGQRESDGLFRGRDTLAATYSGPPEQYRLHFSFMEEVDRTESDYQFTVRFVLSNSRHLDIDTSFAMYKYPYAAVEIYLDYRLLFDPYTPVQDFEIQGEH